MSSSPPDSITIRVGGVDDSALSAALLRHTFRLMRDRGIETVRLGVDAHNPTGATRLYERAGMRIEHADHFYEKALT